MSVLNRIAYFQNRRDEAPNQKLARELAESKDKKGIQEIAENLGHKNQNVQSDCLKVLYEIGYLAPELIADHVDEFLKLLKSKNNRMVWGSMIALATIAELKPREIWKHVDDVTSANSRRKRSMRCGWPTQGRILVRPGSAAIRDDAVPACAAQENHPAIGSAVRRVT